MSRRIKASMFGALYAPPGVHVPAPRERKVGTKRGHPERDVQRAGVRFLRTVLPDAIVAAVKNERGARSSDPDAQARYGAQMQADGVLAGFWDVVCLLPNGRTLLVEFKAPGGRVSDAQAILHHKAGALGHPSIVAMSVEQLRAGLLACGIKTREAAHG